jgi:hypothetical protein
MKVRIRSEGAPVRRRRTFGAEIEIAGRSKTYRRDALFGTWRPKGRGLSIVAGASSLPCCLSLA